MSAFSFLLLILFFPHASPSTEPQQYLDPTLPPFLSPPSLPFCSTSALNHSFANTYSLPPSTANLLLPPTCPPPWSLVILHLSLSCHGHQHPRIAAIWIDGVEILRTSTPQPTPSGVFWTVRKDITRYSSVLRRPGGFNLSMMLENIVDQVHTGIYQANVSLDFYPDDSDDDDDVKVKPADAILPVSTQNSSNGFWFRMQNHSESYFSRIRIPQNTFRAVLEVYHSFHSNDEFWYSNPPDVYIKDNNLTTERGNGAFREIFATVDGRFAGVILPFPVIFPGGINPLFWSPVVAIAAFDLPSYNLDLSPFLELLLDGKHHSIGFGVTDGISFCLLDANLHLWLDSYSKTVTAKLVRYDSPPLSVARTNKFLHLNGTFKIDAERKLHFAGWLNSSMGNLTTEVNQKLKFKSSVEFLNDGNYKEVHLKSKFKTEVKIKNSQNVILSRFSHKFKYPLMILTETLPGMNNTYKLTTNLTHTLYEEATFFMLEKSVTTKILSDKQEAFGWMEVQDHSVLSGSAGSQQLYQYLDGEKCYERNLKAQDGMLLDDSISNACSLAF